MKLIQLSKNADLRHCKKLMFVLTCFLLLSAIWTPATAELITEPEEGVAYYVIHSSGNYLTDDNNMARIIAFDASADSQKFIFRKRADSGDQIRYDIECVGTGMFMYREGWTTLFGTDPNINELDSYFMLTAVDANSIVIHSNTKDWSNYLGTDSQTSGSDIYSNKSEGSYWHLTKAGGVSMEEINELLSEADALLEDVVIGTTQGTYTQANYDALANTISGLRSLLESSPSQDVIDQAVTNLRAAMATFKSAMNPFASDDDRTYIIYYKDTQLVLTITPEGEGNPYNNAQLMDYVPGTAEQVFHFSPEEGNKYKIYNDLDVWLKISGGWDTKWGDFSESSVFTIETVDGTYVRIKSSNGYLGAQIGSPSDIYSNWGSENVFRLVEKADGVDTSVINAKLAEANKVKSASHVGTAQGQYKQADYDTFTNAINTAQNIADTSADQLAINGATGILDAAITAFKATMIEFAPVADKEYSVFHKVSGLVLSFYYNETDYMGHLALQEYEEGLGEQLIICDAVDGEAGKYYIKNADGFYLYADANGWDLRWMEDLSEELPDNNMFTFKTIDESYLLISSALKPNNYFGIDNATVGSDFFYDKNNAEKGYFSFVPQGGTSIETTTAKSVAIITGNRTLQIKDLKNATISIYTTIGQLISTDSHVYGDFNKTLNSGIYVVVIDGKAYKACVK